MRISVEVDTDDVIITIRKVGAQEFSPELEMPETAEAPAEAAFDGGAAPSAEAEAAFAEAELESLETAPAGDLDAGPPNLSPAARARLKVGGGA